MLKNYEYGKLKLKDICKMKRYKYMVVNIAYDYQITIIIREYEICTEHKIHMDCLLIT